MSTSSPYIDIYLFLCECPLARKTVYIIIHCTQLLTHRSVSIYKVLNKKVKDIVIKFCRFSLFLYFTFPFGVE